MHDFQFDAVLFCFWSPFLSGKLHLVYDASSLLQLMTSPLRATFNCFLSAALCHVVLVLVSCKVLDSWYFDADFLVGNLTPIWTKMSVFGNRMLINEGKYMPIAVTCTTTHKRQVLHAMLCEWVFCTCHFLVVVHVLWL